MVCSPIPRAHQPTYPLDRTAGVEQRTETIAGTVVPNVLVHSAFPSTLTWLSLVVACSVSRECDVVNIYRRITFKGSLEDYASRHLRHYRVGYPPQVTKDRFSAIATAQGPVRLVTGACACLGMYWILVYRKVT